MTRLQSLEFICTAILLLTPRTSFASTTTISNKGINSDSLVLSNGLPLDGFGIKIGQVEERRPAINGTDATANLDVNPTAVTLLDGQMVIENEHLGDGHAERVASVIISTDLNDSSMPPNGDAPTGVALNASLYASAYIIGGGGAGAYQDAIVTMQYVSSLADMRAVNNSWGKPKEAPANQLDGSSLLTLALDWLANKYPDALQVVAGNEDVGGGPLPTDNYNGVTIGSSSQAADGIYRQVASGMPGGTKS